MPEDDLEVQPKGFVGRGPREVLDALTLRCVEGVCRKKVCFFPGPRMIPVKPPPVSALLPAVFPVMELDCGGLSPYDNYSLEFEPQLGCPWSSWPGLFTPTAPTNTQYVLVTNNVGFFRLLYVP